MRCGVLGAGAWGTALANLLADNGHETMLWAHEPDVAESINAGRGNPRFLPGATLRSELRATVDKQAAVNGAELVVFAAPSHVLRDVAGHARAWASKGATRFARPCRDTPQSLRRSTVDRGTSAVVSRQTVTFAPPPVLPQIRQ